MLNGLVRKVSLVLQSSCHFIIVADDSYVICIIFRNQDGCGRQTAGSARDNPEEEQVAGREPRPQGQEGCEVQGSIQNKKGLVNVFQIFTVQAARKAKRADIVKHDEKFAKEYQDQESDEIRHTLYRCHWAENYIYSSQKPYLKSYCNKESNIK